MQAFLVAHPRIAITPKKTITMPTKANKVKGYYEEAYPPFPTKATSFFRRNIVFQFFRFIVLNLKIMRIIVGGHS